MAIKSGGTVALDTLASQALRTDSADSLWIYKKTVDEFKSEDLMYGTGIVPVSFKMTAHDGLDPWSLQVGPGKSPRIEQHFLNILR